MDIKKIAKRAGWSLLIIVIIICVGLVVYVKLNERKLIYHTEVKNVDPPDSLQLNYSEVTIDMPQGTKLVCGVMNAHQADTTSAWILYLHGDGGFDKSDIVRCQIFHDLGFNVLAVHYRGYGKSIGEAGESSLFADGEAAYNFLRTVKGASPTKIILYGHSMGTAIAIFVATKLPAAGLAIEGALTSWPALAHYYIPYIPWDLLLSERLESIKRIGGITIPKLVIHSSDDKAVPISHGQELFAKAVEPKTFLEIKGTHNYAPATDQAKFKAALVEFCQKVLR